MQSEVTAERRPAEGSAGAAQQEHVARRYSLGWYATFFALAVVAFVLIGALTGQDALAASARFLWNALVLAFNSVTRILGSLGGVLARGLGLRRISRFSASIAGVGLGYAGNLVLSESGVRRARGWREKLRVAATIARERWRVLPLLAKLAIVAVVIASQLYLHSLLILFPIAFLVPVVRRFWVQAADLLFRNWYRRLFGRMHRRVAVRIRRLPLTRSIRGALRLARLRYLCAWRLWKYHPRYRGPDGIARPVSLIEPLRLWRRGELDLYVRRPLLAGSREKRGALEPNISLL